MDKTNPFEIPLKNRVFPETVQYLPPEKRSIVNDLATSMAKGEGIKTSRPTHMETFLPIAVETLISDGRLDENDINAIIAGFNEFIAKHKKEQQS